LTPLLRGVTRRSPRMPSRMKRRRAEVRAYDIGRQERISARGRMPTLEIINERFARQISAVACSNRLIRRNAGDFRGAGDGHQVQRVRAQSGGAHQT